MNARTRGRGKSDRLLERSSGHFPCNRGAVPARVLFAFATALLLFASVSHGGAPTVTKVTTDDDRRYVDVKIDSRMNEGRLLRVAASVKAALPQFDGETSVRFRLPGQEEDAAWARVILADGRKPFAIMNGFSPKEVAGLVDPEKEQWLLAGDLLQDETLYTITIDGNVPTMVIHTKDLVRITHQSTELRYSDGWLYDNTDHRYRFSDGTKMMHIQYWSGYVVSWFSGKWNFDWLALAS